MEKLPFGVNFPGDALPGLVARPVHRADRVQQLRDLEPACIGILEVQSSWPRRPGRMTDGDDIR